MALRMMAMPCKSAYETYLSEYCTILPFFDHVIQFGPGVKVSDLFKTRITRGVSLVGGLAMLQTLKSPSWVWVASMSDFCLEEEACHARAAMGEGPREVDKVCRMVNVGCRDAKRIDPLLYL